MVFDYSGLYSRTPMNLFRYLANFWFSSFLQWRLVFATNSNFVIPISLQPDGVNLKYFKLTLFDLTEV